MNLKNIITTIIVFSLLVLVSGCSKTITEVKNEEYIDKEVKVSGTVENTIKIGDLSGFTLVDENNDKIAVATKDLPNEGDKVTVNGIIRKNLVLGYYIEVED